jgi:hypothetical protein
VQSIFYWFDQGTKANIILAAVVGIFTSKNSTNTYQCKFGFIALSGDFYTWTV